MIMSSKACEYIGLTGAQYGKTASTYMKDKAKAKQLALTDAIAVRDIQGPPPEITEEIGVKAYMVKIKRDLEIHRKITNARFMTPQK